MRRGENDIVHLFHWPAYTEYQEGLLKVMALPFGAKGELSCGERWAHPKFVSSANDNTVKGMDAILWVLSRCTNGSNKLDFHFACLVRLLKITEVEQKGGRYWIYFLSKEFPKEFMKVNEIQQLENQTGIEFCGNEIPYPGSGEDGSHIHVVRMDTSTISANTRKELQLEELHEVLRDILYDPDHTPPVKMEEYPLLTLNTIGNSKLNSDGLYELSLRKDYNLPFSWYQAEEHRNRDIYINESRCVGKHDNGTILVKAESVLVSSLKRPIMAAKNGQESRGKIPTSITFTNLLFLTSNQLLLLPQSIAVASDAENSGMMQQSIQDG